MLIPVRCFTCGKVVGNKWETYLYYLSNGDTKEEACNKLDLKRFCCRRMILTNINIIDKILVSDNVNGEHNE